MPLKRKLDTIYEDDDDDDLLFAPEPPQKKRKLNSPQQKSLSFDDWVKKYGVRELNNGLLQRFQTSFENPSKLLLITSSDYDKIFDGDAKSKKSRFARLLKRNQCIEYEKKTYNEFIDDGYDVTGITKPTPQNINTAYFYSMNAINFGEVALLANTSKARAFRLELLHLNDCLIAYRKYQYEQIQIEQQETAKQLEIMSQEYAKLREYIKKNSDETNEKICMQISATRADLSRDFNENSEKIIEKIQDI